MTDSTATGKKSARTFDFQAMLDQAKAGAQERSHVDWTSEIEKAKEENETRLAEMKSKANEAAKKMHTNTINNNDDDGEDFGPSIDLANMSADTTTTSSNNNNNDDDDSSDDEDGQQSQVCSICILF
jgi:hypothetical protein